MIQYIIISFFLVILFFYIYIKWSHPFWCIQPVYHKYNIFFWGRKGIIRKKPKKNKYCNFNIQFFKTDDFRQWKEFQKLISGHFLKKADNAFTPSLNELQPYFTGHSPCYISIYTVKEQTYSDKIEKIVGVITSRPLYFQCKNTKENIYYIDYLCVDKSERKKGITQQLIQTHEYNQSSVSKTQISFFKREGKVPLIVPFVKYKSTVFSMIYWKEAKCIKYKIIRVTPNNIHIFHDYFERQLKSIDYAFYTDIGNILELIKTNNIFVYMCLTDDVISCYFFRKSCTKIKGKELLILYASLRSGEEEEFVHLFKCSLSSLMKTEKGYVYLCVEELGENIKISENLQIKTSPIDKIDTSYFFYNYIHKTVSAEKCLILA